MEQFLRMTNVLKKINLPFTGVLFFLISYSLFKYSKVMFSGDLALANSGDGLGTIAGIFALQDLVHNGGWQYLFSDLAWYENHGQALAAPGPSSQFWKMVSFIVGSFFVPETAYDVIAMIGYFLTSLIAYVLFRYLGLNRTLSLILCISFASMDNTLVRAQAHLFGLGVAFAPLLVALLTVYAAKNRTTRALIYLALAHVFNFNVNEYYGYFGVFFTISFLFSSFTLNIRKQGVLDLLVPLSVALLFFILLMLLLYPNVIFEPAFNALFGKNDVPTTSSHTHDWNSFSIYTLKSVYPIFESNILSLDRLMNREVFHSETWEMSYRLGIVVPCLIIFLNFVIFIKDFPYFILTAKKIFPWLVAASVLFLFALDVRKPYSLVFLTYELAPMFRVGLRSLLYFNVAMFSILSISIVGITKVYSEELNNIKYKIFGFSLILALLLVHNDTTRIDMFQKFPGLKFSSTSPYESVKEMPSGILLEIPFYSPISDPPESNYQYMVNRMFHEKALANQVYYGSNNTVYREELDTLSKKVNDLSTDTLDELIYGGVSYIAVSNESLNSLESLYTSNKVALIVSDETISIFEVVGRTKKEDISVADFLKKIMD